MQKICFLKKADGVVFHTSLKAMREIEGTDAFDLEMPLAEYEAAGSLARLIDGEIVVGKTQTEPAAELAEKRIAEIESELAVLDLKSSRASRVVALAVANGGTPASGDVQRLETLEAEAADLRSETQALKRRLNVG